MIKNFDEISVNDKGFFFTYVFERDSLLIGLVLRDDTLYARYDGR